MRDTIDMARESLVIPFFIKETHNELIARLKDFEAMVRADEREACAKFFDNHWRETWTDAQSAEAIRAMGDAK